MSRTACMWIPQYEMQVLLTTHPAVAGIPLVIADVAMRRAQVTAVSPQAAAVGIQRYMLLDSARALCPDLTVMPPDPEGLHQHVEQILAMLYQFSPVVGTDDHEAFFFSLKGLERLHRDELALAQKVQHALGHAGVSAAIAISDTPLSAWVIAGAIQTKKQNESSIRIIPAGQEKRFIGKLSIDAIPMQPNMSKLCKSLGIRRVSDLQQLPHGALSRRFGCHGAFVEQLINAHSCELFRTQSPLSVEQSSIELDQPTTDLEPLLFLHKRSLDQLLKQVAATRRAIAALELTLTLADSDRTQVVRIFRSAQPTLKARTLLDLITLWLNTQPVSEPVNAICMRAIEVATATQRQLDLFAHKQEHALDALNNALSRIRATFGSDAVVQPQLVASYQPEARLQWQPVTTSIAEKTNSSTSHTTQLYEPLPHTMVLSLIDPPQPIEVSVSHWRLSAKSRWRRIVQRLGPYAVEGQWWNTGFCREYAIWFTEQSETLWVFRDAHGYYLQGYLD